jgi:hypothetical protein
MGAVDMTEDDFSVTMKTSVHRGEAWCLVIEGYRIIARAAAGVAGIRCRRRTS